VTDMTLTLPDNLVERVNERASELGYKSPDEYMLALLEADLNDDDDSNEEIIANFKEAWREIKRGEFMTMDELKRYVESSDDG